MNTLPLPSFFEPANAEHWGYTPDFATLALHANEWRRAHQVRPSGTDRLKIAVVPIDMQDDFCHPNGTLFVAGRSGRGAIDDNVRAAEFIYRNLHLITDIKPTFDTHFAFQIFFAPFWQGPNGEPLHPHSLIILNDEGNLTNIDLAGRIILTNVRPRPELTSWLCNGNYSWLVQQVRHYVHELKRMDKYTLYLWPPHTLLGTPGHAMSGIMNEARFFHSFVRSAQSWAEIKGTHPLSENYSVFRGEVLTSWQSTSLIQKNVEFVNTLVSYDIAIFLGQAASHCVKSSIDDFLDELIGRDPTLVRKIYILRDCMSAVTVPDGKGGFAADFTKKAEAALDKFANAGMHVVESRTPIENWPDMPKLAA